MGLNIFVSIPSLRRKNLPKMFIFPDTLILRFWCLQDLLNSCEVFADQLLDVLLNSQCAVHFL